MPRTKLHKVKKNNDVVTPVYSKKLRNNNIDRYLEALEREWKVKERERDAEFASRFTMIDTIMKECILLFDCRTLSKTIGELKMEVSSDISEYNSTYLKNLTLNSTKNSKTVSRKPLKRNSSADDDGYVTAGSNKSETGSRKSRTVAKIPRIGRASRSLSRSNMLKQTSAYKTPANRGIHRSNSATATITPKVKANTPQVILRRPKQGEMAISMQGSPLMVSSVVSDEIANVNIPLQDGRLLSIQPQRGLRTSEIPALSTSTRRQLETLRDNLINLCRKVQRE